MLQTFVQSFTHLKDMPKAERALPMLQRVASLVKPIMRKHGWVLPVLSEFFPEDSSLVGLNVNGGQQILLRLRLPRAPDTFYEEDQVVRVMLHELTHNVHGPHDEQFYKYLGGLEDEYDALQRSGYAGEGFFSPGYRLGMGVSHNLPNSLARVRAADSAERRRWVQGLSGGGGGNRLGGAGAGGTTSWVGDWGRLSPRELAAKAAERRLMDEWLCGSGALALSEAAKAAKASVRSGPVDLTQDEDDAKQWTCPECTLINDGLFLQCAACCTKHPSDTPSGWTCRICTERGIPHELSSCSFCGVIRTENSAG